MEPPARCQSCHRNPGDAPYHYRKGPEIVSHEGFLQCDVCERYACAHCLQVYDILSGYDFLCDTCAATFYERPWSKGH